MAKQQFTFTLSALQVRAAIEAYAAGMVDTAKHDIVLGGALPGACIVSVTRKRAPRKVRTAPKPETPKAAA